MRFDCDLSLDVHYPEMKKHKHREFPPEFYYQQGLGKKLRKQIEDDAGKLRK